jgi:hypothetical protein
MVIIKKFVAIQKLKTDRNGKLRLSRQVKGKAIPLQARTGPEGSRRLRLPAFPDNRYMKVVRLSALCTGHLYPRKHPWCSFPLQIESTPGP